VPVRLYLEALHDDYEGLRFLLRGEDATSRTLRPAFESPVAYRNINESYLLKTWAAILDMQALPSLLTVESSTWVQWLVEEACGVIRAETLVHYAIYTPEDCVDVVTEFPPTVEWLNP
jgi:hypothetical protein